MTRRDADLRELLRSSPVFARLDRSDLARVAGLARQASLAPGTVLFRQGDVATAFYVLIAGTVRLATAGRTVVVPPGSCFGELDVLEDARRPATATTDGPVEIAVVPRDDFEALLAQDGELLVRLAEGLTRRAGDTSHEGPARAN